MTGRALTSAPVAIVPAHFRAVPTMRMAPLSTIFLVFFKLRTRETAGSAGRARPRDPARSPGGRLIDPNGDEVRLADGRKGGNKEGRGVAIHDGELTVTPVVSASSPS